MDLGILRKGLSIFRKYKLFILGLGYLQYFFQILIFFLVWTVDFQDFGKNNANINLTDNQPWAFVRLILSDCGTFVKYADY